eukprot:2464817-Rhodomonas_salina.1
MTTLMLMMLMAKGDKGPYRRATFSQMTTTMTLTPAQLQTAQAWADPVAWAIVAVRACGTTS